MNEPLSPRMQEALSDLRAGVKVECSRWLVMRMGEEDPYFRLAPYREDTLRALRNRGLAFSEHRHGRPARWHAEALAPVSPSLTTEEGGTRGEA